MGESFLYNDGKRGIIIGVTGINEAIIYIWRC
jgi:hypothetical protein